MATILQIILGLVGLAATVFIWWTNNDAEKKKEKSDAKEKISNDVKSGDVSYINSLVMWLRRKKN